VPSPDWRDQIVHFVLTDRLADGDLKNNDQGVGACDPTRFYVPNLKSRPAPTQ